MFYEGLDAKEIAERTQEAKGRIASGKIDAKTDRGIRLGMSKREVTRILGTPNRTMWSTRFRADEIIYTRATPKDKEGVWTLYANYYLFRAGKLFYIELARDAIGGA